LRTATWARIASITAFATVEWYVVALIVTSKGFGIEQSATKALSPLYLLPT
jgi:hypothetical protein